MISECTGATSTFPTIVSFVELLRGVATIFSGPEMGSIIHGSFKRLEIMPLLTPNAATLEEAAPAIYL